MTETKDQKSRMLEARGLTEEDWAKGFRSKGAKARAEELDKKRAESLSKKDEKQKK
jgi:hypothetical protein